MNPADLRTWCREMRLTRREAAEVVGADLRTTRAVAESALAAHGSFDLARPARAESIRQHLDGEGVCLELLPLMLTGSVRWLRSWLELALAASGCHSARVAHRPWLLSDNGASYVAGGPAANGKLICPAACR